MVTFSFIASALIELLLPITAAIIIWKKFRTKWGLFGIGMLSFIASQLIHIPLLGLYNQLASRYFPIVSDMMQILISAVVLGLLAGLCEELVRWGVLHIVKHRANRWDAALMLGAGHGGIESMIVGFSVLATGISFVVMQGQPTLAPEAAAAYKTLLETPFYLPFLGAFERVAAMILHLTLSVMVWTAYRHREVLFLFAAIAWHAVVDAVVVYLAGIGWSAAAIEGAMLVFTIINVIFFLWLKRSYGDMTMEEEEEEEEIDDLDGSVETEMTEESGEEDEASAPVEI
ncbi:MAG: YhfC family intramembrane metalloprotease [Anaerolineaceae bacterium]|nr:YhfC family intramembrane metalloprotease [Anaerolineaceae bacterium]